MDRISCVTRRSATAPLEAASAPGRSVSTRPRGARLSLTWQLGVVTHHPTIAACRRHDAPTNSTHQLLSDNQALRFSVPHSSAFAGTGWMPEWSGGVGDHVASGKRTPKLQRICTLFVYMASPYTFSVSRLIAGYRPRGYECAATRADKRLCAATLLDRQANRRCTGMNAADTDGRIRRTDGRPNADAVVAPTATWSRIMLP